MSLTTERVMRCDSQDCYASHSRQLGYSVSDDADFASFMDEALSLGWEERELHFYCPKCSGPPPSASLTIGLEKQSRSDKLPEFHTVSDLPDIGCATCGNGEVGLDFKSEGDIPACPDCKGPVWFSEETAT